MTCASLFYFILIYVFLLCQVVDDLSNNVIVKIFSLFISV